jgi:hypothetical protein
MAGAKGLSRWPPTRPCDTGSEPVAERFNSRLQEESGAGNVMVRGAEKVKLHLMFGVIALFAEQLLKLIA